MITSVIFATVATQIIGHDQGGAFLSSTQLTWITSNFAVGEPNELYSGNLATSFISGWMRMVAVDIKH